jgi:bifunctional N-acetylglucosamine-1-phosphate-uridyltransferase/glucosamine-1-phosphate-acetyltransferase GlmU-like protein
MNDSNIAMGSTITESVNDSNIAMSSTKTSNEW